jgi:hypothetical protein
MTRTGQIPRVRGRPVRPSAIIFRLAGRIVSERYDEVAKNYWLGGSILLLKHCLIVGTVTNSPWWTGEPRNFCDLPSLRSANNWPTTSPSIGAVSIIHLHQSGSCRAAARHMQLTRNQKRRPCTFVPGRGDTSFIELGGDRYK